MVKVSLSVQFAPDGSIGLDVAQKAHKFQDGLGAELHLREGLVLPLRVWGTGVQRSVEVEILPSIWEADLKKPGAVPILSAREISAAVALKLGFLVSRLTDGCPNTLRCYADFCDKVAVRLKVQLDGSSAFRCLCVHQNVVGSLHVMGEPSANGYENGCVSVTYDVATIQGADSFAQLGRGLGMNPAVKEVAVCI